MAGEAQRLSTEPGKRGASVNRGLISLTTDLRASNNESQWFQSSGERKGPFVYTRLTGEGGGPKKWKSPGDDNFRAGLTSGIINTPLTIHPVALAEDTKRITKMLASANGLKFATHMLENAALAVNSETHWAKKNNTFTRLGPIIAQEAVAAAAATTDVIAQTAVAGTGAHLEPFRFRAKLNGGLVSSPFGGPSWQAQLGEEIDTVNYDGGRVASDAEKVRNITKGTVPGIKTEQDDDALNQLNLIPFEIVSIVPDGDEKEQYLYFQANLDSFDDDYSGNWETQQYVGRGDPMYTYTGFSRKISFSFKIAARSQEELAPLYAQLNALVGTTAPNYDEDGSFMRGTFVSVTIGDLLKNQKGFFTNVKTSWKQDYPWNIGNDTRGEYNLIVPHVLDVSVSFTPILDFNATSRTDPEYLGKYIVNIKSADHIQKVTEEKAKNVV